MLRFGLFSPNLYIQSGFKVRGLGGSAPQLLAQGEWGGRLRKGIRERGMR